MIRQQRKEDEPFEDPLRALYRFATLFGLVHPEQSPDDADEDSPEDVWEAVQDLELPYAEVGYRKLELLNKTDKKWLVEAWGEPKTHLRPVARAKAPESTEPEPQEIYRPPSAPKAEERVAPLPRHTYDGGVVEVPEEIEDAVYDLMSEMASEADDTGGRNARKGILKLAASLVGKAP